MLKVLAIKLEGFAPKLVIINDNLPILVSNQTGRNLARFKKQNDKRSATRQEHQRASLLDFRRGF